MGCLDPYGKVRSMACMQCGSTNVVLKTAMTGTGDEANHASVFCTNCKSVISNVQIRNMELGIWKADIL